MALSNMRREPRREITETVVGLALVATLPAADCVFAACVHDPYGFWDGMGLGVVLLGAIALGLILLCALALIIHALGEATCNALERGGVQLRPRQRY